MISFFSKIAVICCCPYGSLNLAQEQLIMSGTNSQQKDNSLASKTAIMLAKWHRRPKKLNFVHLFKSALKNSDLGHQLKNR